MQLNRITHFDMYYYKKKPYKLLQKQGETVKRLNVLTQILIIHMINFFRLSIYISVSFY